MAEEKLYKAKNLNQQTRLHHHWSDAGSPCRQQTSHFVVYFLQVSAVSAVTNSKALMILEYGVWSSVCKRKFATSVEQLPNLISEAL